MTSWITRALGPVLVGLAASAFGQEPAVVVGAVVSQSGAHAELAFDYGRALLLWEAQVNASGGLLGRPVELRLLDDASSAAQAGRLYAQLIREGADLLIGPYGSAATLLAAAQAERARRVLLNGGGAAGGVHKRKPKYVFQATIPYSAYGAAVLEAVRQDALRRVFILTRDDPASREMAEATHAAALAHGLESAGIEVLSGGSDDFSTQVAKARAAGADAWIAFVEVRDAAGMVKTFKGLDYAPRLFFARAAVEPGFIALVGQDGEFSLGSIEYDARLPAAPNPAFAREFAAKWSAQPGRAAAGGYAAATVLAAAVRRAGTLDQEKLREALAALETVTVLGPYKVDAASGAQLAMQPALAQIQRGQAQVVWPEAQAAARRLPYPRWSERKIIE